MRKVKTDARGWVCAVGAVVLSCSAAFLSGCTGLVSGANNPPPQSTLVISNVQTGTVTTSGSQIVWPTNIPVNSSPAYETPTTYATSTPVDSTIFTRHQLTISGPPPAT